MNNEGYEPIIKERKHTPIPEPKTIDSIQEIDEFLSQWSNAAGLLRRPVHRAHINYDPIANALLDRRNELTRLLAEWTEEFKEEEVA